MWQKTTGVTLGYGHGQEVAFLDGSQNILDVLNKLGPIPYPRIIVLDDGDVFAINCSSYQGFPPVKLLTFS
jgi:hypothetical protein